MDRKELLCSAVCKILNRHWQGKAAVRVINARLYWFGLLYNSEFDARRRLGELGLHYDAHPKNRVPDRYEQIFFLDRDSFLKIAELLNEKV